MLRTISNICTRSVLFHQLNCFRVPLVSCILPFDFESARFLGILLVLCETPELGFLCAMRCGLDETLAS